LTGREIIEELEKSHQELYSFLDELSDEELLAHLQGKWSAAQQLVHLVKSVRILRMAMRVPQFLIKWKYGTANRKSRTYDALVERYKRKLEEIDTSRTPFAPGVVEASEVDDGIIRLKKELVKLKKQFKKLSEEQLDKLILPHPLLGRCTLREMGYFTIYHVQHHRELMTKQLDSLKVG
jgi:hypothetical protein